MTMGGMQRIAFLGTGLIGGAMARGALGRGEQIVVWNRTMDKARPLEAMGADVAESAAEAVEGAARVHVALSDDDAVDAVLGQVAPRVGLGVIVVDHTTTSTAGTTARSLACERRGIAFLHAPVFMSPAMCETSKGLMLCAGPWDRFERVQRALARMTGDLWWVGERPDLAAAQKLFGNAMIAAIVGGLADVFSMATALGIRPEEAFALFSRFKPGRTVDVRGARMARGEFSPTFTLAMARKDVRLMLEAAGASQLAVLPALAKRMDQVIAAGHGAEDFGALAADAIEAGRRIGAT